MEKPKQSGQVRRIIGQVTHGKSGAPVYWVWHTMKNRCSNPKSSQYELYGARGITVCERWLRFENFYADMGDPPKGMSIERIDNNGNYEPSNCKWATKTEQGSNKRNNHIIEVNGVRRTQAEWARSLNVRPQVIVHRLRRGWSESKAVLTPLKI